MSNLEIDVPEVKQRPVPITVRVVGILMTLLALVSIVGSFIFAFPLGGVLGYTIGPFLIAVGIAYLIVVSRLRRGERSTWIAAVALPIVHTLTLNTIDLVREGRIPSEDYPFMAVSALIVLLLMLSPSRRFFGV